MALSLSNLLAELRYALRNPDASSSDCYTYLNSAKDEFQARAIRQLGMNALNTTAKELSITTTSAYSYSLASASPAIGRIIEVKVGDGTHYLNARQTEGLWSTGMYYDRNNPEYRINGNYLEIKFEPSTYSSIIVVYAPQIYNVSATYTGDSTTQSYQIDEVDRAWAWDAAGRYFDSIHEDNSAARCRMVRNEKLQGIMTGDAI